MNMRFWLLALAEPNRTAAQVLTTSPMNVRTFGLMRESASQRTIVSSRTPQARPKADVQEAAMKYLVYPERRRFGYALDTTDVSQVRRVVGHPQGNKRKFGEKNWGKER